MVAPPPENTHANQRHQDYANDCQAHGPADGQPGNQKENRQQDDAGDDGNRREAHVKNVHVGLFKDSGSPTFGRLIMMLNRNDNYDLAPIFVYHTVGKSIDNATPYSQRRRRPG